MKKFILFFVLLFCVSSTTAFAEGEFDGIWLTPIGFISMHENDGILVAVQLQADARRWFPYTGVLKGNKATVTSVPFIADEDAVVVLDVEFHDDSNATATGVSCEPVELCAEFGALVEQLGGEFEAQKIW